MKAVRRVVFLLCVLLLGAPIVSAQSATTTDVYSQVTSLVNKYQKEKGVKSLMCDDGMMLKTVKMMLRKDFGKEFVDGIKAFAILFCDDEKGVVANKVAGDVEQIAAQLQQVNVDGRMKPETQARGFVRLTESGDVLTDLLIIIDKPSPKIVYFNGEFKPDKIDKK